MSYFSFEKLPKFFRDYIFGMPGRVCWKELSSVFSEAFDVVPYYWWIDADCWCAQSLPADMPAAKRDIEVKLRKDESKLQQSEALQEFNRRQHEFLETDIRKVHRCQLLQLGQLEQRQNQEVWHHDSFYTIA